MLPRCCFHHLIEDSILYKKIYSTFAYDQYFFQKIKSYGLSVIGGKVDGQILFGTMSEKPFVYYTSRLAAAAPSRLSYLVPAVAS